MELSDFIENWKCDGPSGSIYIPSKGRAGFTNTNRLLEARGLKYKFVVEPTDLDSYKEAYPESEFIVLPECDKGIAYVRNFIKNYSTSVGEEFHWQVDDDVKQLKRSLYIDGKLKRINCPDISPFVLGHDIMKKYHNVGQVGLSHDIFVFTKPQPYELNKQACSVFMVRNNVKATFDGTVPATQIILFRC